MYNTCTQAYEKTGPSTHSTLFVIFPNWKQSKNLNTYQESEQINCNIFV